MSKDKINNNKNKKNKGNPKINIWYYLKIEKARLIAYLCFSLLFYAAQITATILIAKFLDKVAMQAYDEALKLVLISGSLLVLANVINWLGNLFIIKAIGNMVLKVRLDLSERSFLLSSKTFSDTQTGTYINRITSDPDTAFWAIDTIIDGISNLLAATFTCVYVIFLNLYIGLLMTVVIVSLSAFEFFRLKKWRKNRRLERKQGEKTTSHANEIVRSEKDIKALNLHSALRETSSATYKNYRDVSYKMRVTNNRFWNLRNLFLAIFSLLLGVIGIVMLKNYALTLAAFLFIFMNRQSLNHTIWYIGYLGDSFSSLKVSSKRMFEIFDDKIFPTEKFGKKHLDKCVGTIEFDKVKFYYVDNIQEEKNESNKDLKKKKEVKDSKKEKPKTTKTKVFNELSFKIVPNTTVAFVGESGSGKSTILNLIAKIYDTNGGRVLIDGADIKSLSKETLRGNITLVNQSPYIFDKTIRENLLLAKSDATDDELIDACKRASFWDFIKDHPKGLDTSVGESGIKLSGGQKQRLAIARALLRQTKIILFDESTSSLDNFSQAEVKKSIDELSRNSTVVIVAHRLSTIKNSDKIYFLDKGEIIGSGSFDELYNNNEKFKKLFTTEII